MSVVMRLRRMGGNQRPFYRLVVADSRNPREGRFLERLGDYDPMRDKDNLRLNPERIEFWLKQGATPSERVNQLLRSKGIRSSKSRGGLVKKEGAVKKEKQAQKSKQKD